MKLGVPSLIAMVVLFACQNIEKASIITNTDSVVRGDNIDIAVTGLTPNEEYIVHLQQMWVGFSLYSHAVFMADEKGQISIDKDESIGGDYYGNDSLALFSYLNSTPVPPYLNKIDLDENDNLFVIQVSKDEKVLAQAKINRIVRPAEGEEHSINEGDLKVNVHELNKSDILVLVLGGSEGNNYFSNLQANMIAAKGFSSAAISYFGGEYQFKSLKNIPLELIDSSRAYIERQIGKYEQVYLMGTSRGAELALLYASYRDDIDGVFAIAPSSYVFQGLESTPIPAWTLNEETIPYLAVGGDETEVDDNGRILLLNKFLASVENADSTTEIEVENIKGDILLFSGQDDQLWPASMMADKIENRLELKGFPYQVYNYQYEHAGHFVSPPAYISQVKEESRFVVGGTLKGDAEAKVEVWQKIMAYLEAKRNDTLN